MHRDTPLRHANAETYVPLPCFLSSASDFKGLNVCIERSWFEAIDGHPIYNATMWVRCAAE